jgi:F0F1-type ATP synthase delta subunit
MSHLTRRHLAEVIAERTLGLPESKLAHEIAAYLLAENQTAKLEPLLRDIMYWREKHGVVEVMAVSAHELTQDVRDDIESIVREHFPSAKSVIINESIDPAVVGGVRLVLAREQLDLTVEAKLNKFKRLTSEGAV